MKTKRSLPSPAFIKRLETVEEVIQDYCDLHWDESLCEYDNALAGDGSCIIGSIEQFLTTYYFLLNHGVK